MAWRCRLLAARRSQHGRVIVHPTHCLICAQVTLTIGGLWVEVHMNYIYGHIAAWAPLENNQAPDKLGLLRAQQMFFVTAPLHTLAIFQGVALCGKQPGASGATGSVERRGTGIATPSSWRRVDGVEVDAATQDERAVKF